MFAFIAGLLMQSALLTLSGLSGAGTETVNQACAADVLATFCCVKLS